MSGRDWRLECVLQENGLEAISAVCYCHLGPVLPNLLMFLKEDENLYCYVKFSEF